MNVNGMPDLSSAKQAGTAKPSKWNSKTSDNSLFQSILGQQSQGRDTKPAPVQQKTTAPDRGTTAKQADRNVSSDTIADNNTTTSTSKTDSTDTASAEVTESVETANGTENAEQGEAVDESGETAEKTDMPDDVSAEAEAVQVAVFPVQIIIVPGPIAVSESVEIRGTMEMVAPPVIQMTEQNAQTIAEGQVMAPEQQAGEAQLETVAVPAADMEQAAVQVSADLVQSVETDDVMPQTEQDIPQHVQASDKQTAEETVQPDVQDTGDAAEHFAAQVVKEARELVNKRESQPGAPVTEESVLQKAEADTTARPVEAAEETVVMQDEPETEPEEETKPEGPKQAAGNTAQTQAAAADSGRIEFRMGSAQPLEAQHAAAPPEPPQVIMNRVLDQVRTAVTPDKTEFFVQLKPDYLGGLSIGLVAEDKGVVAKIMTSSQQVHNVLQADMNQMVQMLRDKGINVVQMEVIYDQTANAMSQNNGDNQQQQFSQSRGRSHGRGADQTDGSASMYDVLSSNEVLAEQGGSVEFSA